MGVYRNKETLDLIDAWMHSAEEDRFQIAFPNWVHRIWKDGVAYTSEGIDYLKTASGDVEIPDGSYIVRSSGGILSVLDAESIASGYRYEM